MKPIATQSKSVEMQETEIFASEVYIHNAGLVLVWPFMYQLFLRAGVLDENGFKSELHACRAACLLEYIATKAEPVSGQNLSLNKLLCGLDITLPLIKTEPLTDQEKDTAEQMLAHVINQWPIGDTSNDGLRGSFLIRNGKITENKNGDNLFVERKGYDMLLDRLPWSLSTIRFSWMKKNLFVLW